MLERNVIAQNVIFLHDFEKNLNTHVRSQHELGNVMLMPEFESVAEFNGYCQV